MLSKILVCLDGSKLAEKILPYVQDEAMAFDGQVVLFQVITLSSQEAPDYRTTFLDQLQVAETTAKLYLESLATQLKGKGIKVDCVTTNTGPVGYAIVNYAHDEGFDLIATTTHGNSGLSRMLLGSVADYVIRNSKLPILIIRPE